MFDERSPIYRQIADQISADVLGGELAADEQVMSTNQYAAFYRINPATAAKAFQLLVDEGVLYKRRGLGLFVAADAREKLRTRHRERFYPDVIEPMLREATAIGISRDDLIAYIAAASPEEGK
jgi:DNA-binding transcriptional regulator YhcF (GntR family)